MILRIFRAIVHDGQQGAFRAFVLDTALPLTRAQDGLVSVTVGLPGREAPREFSMVSVWRDLEALKAFTGEEWKKPVVLPEEAHLLEASHLHHYEVAEA
jgi:quinol monooxygenase YgiN